MSVTDLSMFKTVEEAREFYKKEIEELKEKKFKAEMLLADIDTKLIVKKSLMHAAEIKLKRQE